MCAICKPDCIYLRKAKCTKDLWKPDPVSRTPRKRRETVALDGEDAEDAPPIADATGEGAEED